MSARHESMQVKYRKDYKPSPYLVREVVLTIDIRDGATWVESQLDISPNPAGESGQPLVLDGEELELEWLELDGRRLDTGDYHRNDDSLQIHRVPQEPFVLRSRVRIEPEKNTMLQGLYASNGKYCTQCEAEGFRRITYFLDRPDILARYTTRIEADRERYPHLLSNGNRVAQGTLAGGRHFAEWRDPFPKPCYLFAAVAGDFDVLEDEFTTRSGRSVQLQIYVDKGKRDQCRHAMSSLKRAMLWDEQTFGREYDLDTYMIVAVSDFNMGAMENKGLNIFNTKYVLASEATATDDDFIGVESVIAHEYFHNWTGNRITCRDWFQLSLKEGLTVFRDQEFTADMHSRGVKRVQDVSVIIGPQFAEDAGPMAHPIRPDAYIEMNNFYTVTVYNKGAEVIRMMRTLIGDEAFRTGMDIYFDRHDGQAVTCEDFIRCMEQASGRDLSQFRHWYSQAGTPELTVTEEWDPETGRFMLVLEQTCKPTPGQPTKEPFHIPVKLAFLDESGQRLHPEGPEARCDEGEWTLELCESRSTYAFSGFAEKPVVSLLREFSAPVRVHRKRTLADQALAFALDDDPYCRWEAGQQLMSQLIWDRYDGQPRDDDMMLVADALTKLLRDERADPAFKALCLRWPASTVLEGQRQGVHPLRLAEAKADAQTRLARQIAEPLSAIALQAKARERAASEAEARGWRALKNQAALFASLGGDAAALEQIRNQFIAASNMTDELAAFEFLVHHGSDEDREQAVSRFLARWQDEELVVDKWLMTQAQRPSGQALDDAARLWNHDVFRPTNPNKVRALAGALAANPWGFHRQDGAGYRWMADTVLAVDRTNPQVAARLVSVFNKWSGYDNATGRMMRESLQAIADAEGLSRDVAEIAEKALQQSSEG